MRKGVLLSAFLATLVMLNASEVKKSVILNKTNMQNAINTGNAGVSIE